MSPRPGSYEKILDAAEEVVLEVGAAHMTLNAVAKKAGISKGGLIYNFPTKETLLQAMVKRLADHFRMSREQKYAELENQPSREVKAHILSFLSHDPKSDKLFAALLAAIAHDPKLLDPVRNEYNILLDHLQSGGLRIERAAVISLASDGLKLMEILKIHHFSASQRKAILNEMLRLADEKTEGEELC